MICLYCNHAMADRGGPTYDHITPKSRGGSNASHNLIVVCKFCNRDKADLAITEWCGWLLAHGDDRGGILHVALLQASADDPDWRASIEREIGFGASGMVGGATLNNIVRQRAKDRVAAHEKRRAMDCAIQEGMRMARSGLSSETISSMLGIDPQTADNIVTFFGGKPT